MRESLRYLGKSKSEDQDLRIATVNHRISMTEKFVAARQMMSSDAQRALDLCSEILFGIPMETQVREREVVDQAVAPACVCEVGGYDRYVFTPCARVTTAHRGDFFFYPEYICDMYLSRTL